MDIEHPGITRCNRNGYDMSLHQIECMEREQEELEDDEDK